MDSDHETDARDGRAAYTAPRGFFHITRAVVKAAKPPASGQAFIRDDTSRGFALRILPSGTKTFTWEGRIKGRMRRLAIGQFPDCTAERARKRADEIRGQVARGEDPSAARTQARQQMKFSELVDWYLEQHAKPHKKSWRRDERRLKTHFKGWLTRRLTDVTVNDVSRAHVRIGATAPVEANRTVSLLRAVFYAAIKADILKSDNPAKGIQTFAEQHRERYLTAEEMGRVNAALIRETEGNWKFRAYFPLLAFLGVRRSELASLRWEHVDLNSKKLRLAETKTGAQLLLPISSPALKILEGLPSRGTSDWVFPTSRRSATGHLTDPFFMWKRIRTRAGVPDVRVHDLRHTLASEMVAQGYSLPVIGRALGHTRAATTQRYAHLQLDVVRDALENTAQRMVAAMAPAADQTTKLPPGFRDVGKPGDAFVIMDGPAVAPAADRAGAFRRIVPRMTGDPSPGHALESRS